MREMKSGVNERDREGERKRERDVYGNICMLILSFIFKCEVRVRRCMVAKLYAMKVLDIIYHHIIDTICSDVCTIERRP